LKKRSLNRDPLTEESRRQNNEEWKFVSSVHSSR
jgi:hypothetical protein